MRTSWELWAMTKHLISCWRFPLVRIYSLLCIPLFYAYSFDPIFFLFEVKNPFCLWKEVELVEMHLSVSLKAHKELNLTFVYLLYCNSFNQTSHSKKKTKTKTHLQLSLIVIFFHLFQFLLFIKSRGGTYRPLGWEQSFVWRWPQPPHLPQRTVLELL